MSNHFYYTLSFGKAFLVNALTEVAKKHIANHKVTAEEVLTFFERDYFVKSI